MVIVFVPLLTTRLPTVAAGPLKVPIWDAAVGALANKVRVGGKLGLLIVTVWLALTPLLETVPLTLAKVAPPL